MKIRSQLFLVAAIGVTLRAQTLSLGSGVATPGSSVAIPLTLSGVSGPASIQWTWTLSQEMVSVSCSPGVCDPSGGSMKVTGSGRIATATFQVSPSASMPVLSVSFVSASAGGSAISTSPGGAWLMGATAPLSRNPCSNIVGPGLTSNTYQVIVKPVTVQGVSLPAQICAPLSSGIVPVVETFDLSGAPAGAATWDVSLSRAPSGDGMAFFASSVLGMGKTVGVPGIGKSIELTLPEYRPFVSGVDVVTILYFSGVQ